MANIVNGGIIVMVAAFGLVAIVGAADEFRPKAGPASSLTEPDAASADPEASETSGLGTLIPVKHGEDDERGDKRGHGDRDRDDGRHDDEDDEDDGHDEDDEDDD